MPIFDRRKKNGQSSASRSSSQFGPKIISGSSKNNRPIVQRSGDSLTPLQGYPTSNTIQAKQEADGYHRVPRFAPTLQELNNHSFRQPSEPILRPQRQYAGLTLQRSPLSSSNNTVIQRDVMTAKTFKNRAKYVSFGKAGSSYTNIKNALTAYHKTKKNASVPQKLAMLRKIGHLCYVWMKRHLTLSVNSGTLNYEHDDNKSRARKAAILELQEQVYAEHHNIVANLQSSALDGGNVLRVYQGQGGTADLRKTTIVSHNFTTCTPIVMFNSSTKLGGLFHYATGSLNDQAMEMVNMAKYIQPTHVYIYGGSHLDVSPNSMNPEDRKYAAIHAENQPAMANFFSFCQTKYNSTVRNEQGFAATISISVDEGELEVNTGLAHPQASTDLRSMKDEDSKDISENLPAEFLAFTSSQIMYDDLEIEIEEMRYEQQNIDNLKWDAEEKFMSLLGDYRYQYYLGKLDSEKVYNGWIAARQQEGIEFSQLTLDDYEDFVVDNQTNEAFIDDFDYGK